MGGKVPAEEMTPERIKLLETTRKVLADPQPRKYDRQGRSEAERQSNTTTGD